MSAVHETLKPFAVTPERIPVAAGSRDGHMGEGFQDQWLRRKLYLEHGKKDRDLEKYLRKST